MQNHLLALNTMQDWLWDTLHFVLEGRDSELTVIQAGRVHQTLRNLPGKRLLQGLPGLESKAKMLPQLLLSYVVHVKEKVDVRRTGYALLLKYGILFPS